MKPKDLFLASFLFFLVLSSWYVMRAVRNELAVENYSDDFLIILLSCTALVMLVINPIYSWIASRSNFKKIVIYCYSFLIINLFVFLFYSRSLTAEDIYQKVWLGRIFYVWANIYSFFVVSIFWVLIINLYRNYKSRRFYGFIMAGGSVGAIFGSELAIRLSKSFVNNGLELFVLTSSILLLLAMLLAIYIFNTRASVNSISKVGGTALDPIKNIITKSEIRLIATYSWLFTLLMTIQWICAIPIVEAYSDLSPERIELFGRIEQLVSPLTLISQVFLTYFVISFIGIRSILIIYGALFVVVFLLYGFYPIVGVVVISQAILRVFEYAFNKPSREIIYSGLEKNDRYKSSVFIDTFLTRFGDLTGSIYIGIGKFLGIGIGLMPILSIPIAGILSLVGIKIFNKEKFKDL
jgi:AAA family ATP:ADP antiporter